jgi:hypothetical protein
MTIKMLLPLLEFKKANMSERRVDGFFYELFMDVAVLGKSGVIPVNPRRAYVNDFALRIGNRATLVSSPGARAYGMLIALTHSELLGTPHNLNRVSN